MILDTSIPMTGGEVSVQAHFQSIYERSVGVNSPEAFNRCESMDY